jgi:hypothetical protein
VLLSIGMKHYASVVQAKARLANDDAYKQIAAQAASTQAETLQALTSIAETLAKMQGRLIAVEQVLKAVE